MIAIVWLALSSLRQERVVPCEGLERARHVMGTRARVVICDPLAEEEAAGAAAAALDILDETDRIMSLYKPASDLSRLNRNGYPGPVSLDPRLIDLLDLSRALARETGGKFDVTIKPLMDHYGFYRALGFTPPAGGLSEALSRVGSESLRVDGSSGTASFGRAGMGVDLGGIAKGWALDRAAATLRERGIRRAIVELGRSFLFMGPGPAPGGLWPVAIVDPLRGESIATCIDVPQGSVSTSAPGGLTIRDDEGREVGHILDPRRGAIRSRILQVTVWSPSGARADALSTAMILLEKNEAESILARNGEAAIRFTRARVGSRGFRTERLGGMRPRVCRPHDEGLAPGPAAGGRGPRRSRVGRVGF